MEAKFVQKVERCGRERPGVFDLTSLKLYYCFLFVNGFDFVVFGFQHYVFWFLDVFSRFSPGKFALQSGLGETY